MNVNILDAVNKHLIEKAKLNDRDYSYFHASEWERCHRKIAYEYYEAIGKIEVDEKCLKIDPQGERIFDNGHGMHHRWGDYIESTGALMGRWKCLNWMAHGDKPYIVGKDAPLGIFRPKHCPVCHSTKFSYVEVNWRCEETNWGGSVDAIVDLELFTKYIGLNVKIPQEYKLMLIDYKTMNPMDFKKLEKPKTEHITQMQIYLYGLGLKHGKFLYEDKGWQDCKEYLVERDDHLIEIKRAEAIELKKTVTTLDDDGRLQLPVRAYSSRAHTDCMRCQYRGDCWDERHDVKRKKAAAKKAKQAVVESHENVNAIFEGIDV